MKLLLDTHAFLWFLANDPMLSPAARTLIEDPNNHKFVSIASCWEIAIKVGLKKLDLGEPATCHIVTSRCARDGEACSPIGQSRSISPFGSRGRERAKAQRLIVPG